MARHGQLTVEIDGGLPQAVESMRDARETILSCGGTASSGRVYETRDLRRGVERRLVAWFRRSTEGDGSRWYRAEIGA